MKYKFFQLPIFQDPRGKLVPVEFKDHVPFEPKRVYYFFENVMSRGGHAHTDEEEVFVCLRGSCTAKIHDGKEWHSFALKAPCDGLYTATLVWHELLDFSKDAILLAISSTSFDPEKKGYIMDFEKFLTLSKK